MLTGSGCLLQLAIGRGANETHSILAAVDSIDLKKLIPRYHSMTFLTDQNQRLWITMERIAGDSIIPLAAEFDVSHQPRLLRTITEKDGLPFSSLRAIYED